MKRFHIAIPTSDGGVELHPMKAWLRQHPAAVPPGLDATLSTSHQLRSGLRNAGWAVQESETDVRLIRPADQGRQEEITGILGAIYEFTAGEDETEAGGDAVFGLEYQLRDFLAQNLATIRIGDPRLQLYVDPTGREGIEYPTDVGPIDLLTVDATGNFYVFELKRARTADRAVGQLARYMGWVKHTIGRAVEVHGVVVAKSIDDRLRYAASVIPRVLLFEYAVEFHLHPVSLSPRVP